MVNWCNSLLWWLTTLDWPFSWYFIFQHVCAKNGKRDKSHHHTPFPPALKVILDFWLDNFFKAKYLPHACFFYQWSTLPRIWLKWNCSKHKIKIFCQRRSYYRVLDKLDPSLGKSEKMLTLLNSWSGQCFMSKIIWKKRNFTFWFLLFFDISVMIQGLNFESGECQWENQMVAILLTFAHFSDFELAPNWVKYSTYLAL